MCVYRSCCVAIGKCIYLVLQFFFSYFCCYNNQLNPITLEAKLFARSLETLSETYDVLDEHLIEALEGVMTSIENFIDKNTNKAIVDTNNTKLINCNGLQCIQRIHHCSHCKRDLGKSIVNVALHLVENCGASLPQKPIERKKMELNPDRILTKGERKQKKKEALEKQREQRMAAAVKINKSKFI